MKSNTSEFSILSVSTMPEYFAQENILKEEIDTDIEGRSNEGTLYAAMVSRPSIYTKDASKYQFNQYTVVVD